MNIKSSRSKLIGAVLFTLFTVIFIQACQSEQELTYARYYINGKKLYEQHCQNCHNADGEGLGGLYPPLTDTVFLRSNKNELACIIKYGLNDTITVDEKKFEGKMPAERQMPDIEIAQIITYITNSFGNKQGLYDVTNATTDLKNCGNFSL